MNPGTGSPEVRGTGIAVVVGPKYLRRFDLRRRGMLWKSLWNCWPRGKFLRVKICYPARAGEFLDAKALNSNQLGNSLGINIGGINGASTYSQFGDLHISRFVTF